ncbi:MAG: M4 family metallopeptidase, partial [Parafilimonas sp.]|nr:M4 family metallopeptidase [Parafilimonas sp.]
IKNYVHYGSKYANAFWWQATLSMYYGDGDNIVFRPLVALDVCAHEFGHGITQSTAGLAPGYQESGALNEGFSDIWGACVEHWAAPSKQTWLIGEEIMANGSDCLRNMQNPKDPLAGEGQHPNTYHGQFWDNNSEPHNNSTVLSHWFYLLCQGGSGTNDIGNIYTVNGIGINNAQLIAYRTEAFYLNSSANYSAARTTTIQAVRDLFGTGSCSEISVTNAWYAAGVGGQYTGGTIPVINGPSAICYNSTATYTLSNVTNGATVTWNASNAYRTVTPSADGLSATVKNITTTSTPSSISVSVNGCSGQLSNSISIALGTPYIAGSYTNTFDNSNNPLGFYPGVTNPACTGYYINTNMEITGASGIPNVTWSKVSSSGVVNFTQTGNDIRFYLFTDNENVVFQLAAQDACGTATKQFKWQASTCSGGSGGGNCFAYDVSPNPTDGDVNVDVENIIPPCNIEGLNTQQDLNNLLITELRVYDVAQHLKKHQKINGVKHIKLDLSSLTNGVYYLEIIGNSGHKEHRLIYKR